MASVQILPKVGENDRREWRITNSGITDADVGKPVTMPTTTLAVTLAVDGDAIYGYIDSVERGTDGGSTVITVLEHGSCRVTASGTIVKGAMVEAGTNTAAGTASVSWGIVSAHVLDDTTTTTLVSSTFAKNWMALTGAADGETLVVTQV